MKEKICVLEKIKWSCTRSLTKYSATNDVENTTNTEKKKQEVKALLHKLYTELYQADEIVEHLALESEKTTSYQPTNEEINAILLFNKDKRFTITE
ncbi:hypothetical protein E0W68_09655 [Flavobacterium salilacus subsp. salilacus]|uniref:hypothetical protein n=1 Tax=Flavobacterium TaxID=237 RepID=UPI0010757C5A|nr:MULTISPECIES: hypothetical protein [Flavobacterium]KAF2518278.1 hypothetical protein E0W68_09655 [Flavobacterium salilacus subsp. salilacus]MBE1615310.1 hypothetical protein [Flavobacterium sp. SaA2.13]